jgi:hypothetical protein
MVLPDTFTFTWTKETSKISETLAWDLLRAFD